MPPGAAIDLTPPRFVEGLADWFCGAGASGGADAAPGRARLVAADPDFGACLELRKLEPEQRLRYMGELPIRSGARVEIRLRLRLIHGPATLARVAATPGAAGGVILAGLPACGAAMALPADGAPATLRLVVGREPGPGVDLVWDARALYAHVGLDLLGPCGGVVRVADLAAREIGLRVLPGFQPRA